MEVINIKIVGKKLLSTADNELTLKEVKNPKRTTTTLTTKSPMLSNSRTWIEKGRN
jgi:hypothetical protein